MIDSHCHLTFRDFAGKTDEELAQCAQHGVTGCITISTTSVDCEHALEIAHAHYDEPARSIQDAVLAEQLAVIENEKSAAGQPGLGKPIVIHCRQAFGDLIPILKSSPLDPARFVFHCFTGNADEARMILDFGAMISFTGVVTYKNARDVQEAARLVPMDRIMVETDAPFLSPMPRRGERPCRPWMTSLTALFLADLRGEDWDTFHHAINDNTARFFGIDAHGSQGTGR